MIILNTKEKRVCIYEPNPRADKDSFALTEWGTLYYYTGISPDHEGHEVKLPKGNWSKLTWLSEITEEQAKCFVETHRSLELYKDYLNDGYWGSFALESFYSLLRSHNLDTSKNLLIILEQ